MTMTEKINETNNVNYTTNNVSNISNNVSNADAVKKKKEKLSLKSPTQERSRQTVNSILEACEKLMISEGFYGITTDKIAKDAGVSIGSLYQFFGNKESVVSALIHRTMENDMNEFKQRALQVAALPVEQKFKAFVEIAFDVFSRKAELRNKLQSIQFYLMDPGFYQNNNKFYQDFITSQLPDIPGRDKETIAFVMYNAFSGILNSIHILGVNAKSEAKLVQEVSHLITTYIKQ